MTSYLVDFIKNNPTDWQEQITNLKIKVKCTNEILSHYIFNYGIGADFNNPLVQESRGIIIDTANLNVICWPFRKFGNYGEAYADKIDWNTAVVTEKLDGSIIKLYYRGGWLFATNSMADANEATINNRTFISLIEDCIEYKILCQHVWDLNTDYTYIFELTHPVNQVVIQYKVPHLYLIGIRNNKTGEEVSIYNNNFRYLDNIPKPKTYSCTSLDECIELAEHSNQSKDVTSEGYVVVDKDFHRIKIKTPEHLFYHRHISNQLSKDHYINLVLNHYDMLDEICSQKPDLAHIINYYRWQVSEWQYKANIMADTARRLMEEFNDRKLVALQIKDNPLSWIGFNALKTDADGQSILLSKPNAYSKLIKEY